MGLGEVCRALQGRLYAGEDLEPQVILVAQAVGTSLDHADLRRGPQQQETLFSGRQ